MVEHLEDKTNVVDPETVPVDAAQYVDMNAIDLVEPVSTSVPAALLSRDKGLQ